MKYGRGSIAPPPHPTLYLVFSQKHILDRVDLLLQPGWLDYKQLYVYGKSLHQQEYKVLIKADLNKQQTSNLFTSQGALGAISPHTAIENISGVRNGKIRADFYDDCQDIPDPSALYPTQKNLLLPM